MCAIMIIIMIYIIIIIIIIISCRLVVVTVVAVVLVVVVILVLSLFMCIYACDMRNILVLKTVLLVCIGLLQKKSEMFHRTLRGY